MRELTKGTRSSRIAWSTGARASHTSRLGCMGTIRSSTMGLGMIGDHALTFPTFWGILGDSTMDELLTTKCVPCRGDAQSATEEQVASFLPQLPDWEIVRVDGVPRLERVFTFPDFLTALDFTDVVGELAEEEGHHPALLTEWGSVKVSWWTHKIRDLHENDFVMAAKTDSAFADRA